LGCGMGAELIGGSYFQKEEIKVSSVDIYIQKFKSKIRDFFPWKFLLKRMQAHD